MLHESESPASPGSSAPARVLIADDGKNAADIMGLFLKMEGHDVRVVYDGAQAISAAADFQPHVIFMDITMPGVDGIEATERILADPGEQVPAIIALTGYDESETRRRCDEAGCRRCVSKPVSPADLRALMKEFAGAAETAALEDPLIPASPGVLPG